MSIKIAIIQSGPEYLDLQKSLEKAENLISEASANGANLCVFGESWLSGYPFWLDHCPETTMWNNPAVKKVFRRTYENAIGIPGVELEFISELARKNKMIICMGVNEYIREGRGNGTIFNSLIIIGSDGALLNHHRKLVPTYTEKLIYGNGDALGLKSVDTEFGRIGALICWEHWNPMARQALHNSGELIHIAIWPSVSEMHQIACRNYAFEGRCFVIAAGQILKVSDIPEELSIPDGLMANPDKLLQNGGSCVIAPDGSFLIEPQFNHDEIIYYNINNIESAIEERMNLDITGHYNRWDIFNFEINNKRP